MGNFIEESELIINEDGSIFHLHLKPENLADKIIVSGDPDRVDTIASHFDSREFVKENREFRTITGSYKGKRITALSHGIGGGCIDIVMTELDALANIDFERRRPKEKHRELEIVRLGTCGGLQEFTPIGTYVCSEYSVGLDNLLHFYADSESVCDAEMGVAFSKHTGISGKFGVPYVIKNSSELAERIAKDDMVHGITCSSCGFYGPQGRVLRAETTIKDLSEILRSFEYRGLKVTNFEMEGAQLAGLATILGHKALTICMVIANRYAKEANTAYKNSIDALITKVLDRI